MGEEHFEEFCSLISGIHGSIQKLKARFTTQLGIKPVHVFWLYLLRVHPDGMSASELAAAGKSDRSLVSREIDYLLDEGMIRSLGSGERRRYGWKLVLTEKGEALASIISAVVGDIQNTVSRDIPKSDLVIFYRTLHALSDSFEKLVDHNKIQETIDHECKIDY